MIILRIQIIILLFSVNEVEKQFNNILYDINGVDGYSKRPTVTDYTSNPTEYLARMQSLRQELKIKVFMTPPKKILQKIILRI